MNNTLQSTQPYPADRSFVLKLHRDADLAGGELRGRIVHLVSDERGDFFGSAELLLTLGALIERSATARFTAVTTAATPAATPAAATAAADVLAPRGSNPATRT